MEYYIAATLFAAYLRGHAGRLWSPIWQSLMLMTSIEKPAYYKK